MSSTTARVSRKIRSRAGYLGLMIASAPMRNAVSVEITTPHACAFSPDALNNRKMTAGTVRPAIAATTGHRRPGAIGELADGELARDLEADDEEEERHQAVVDQMLDRQFEGVVAEREADMGVQ